MKRTTIALIAVVLLVALAGCSSGGDTSPETETPEPSDGLVAVEDADSDRGYDEIKAYYDEQGEMVCYTYRDGGNAAATGGLDCEPINETAYEPEDFQ